MLDELDVVAGPDADVGLQLLQPFVQIRPLQVVGDDEQIDVRLLVISLSIKTLSSDVRIGTVLWGGRAP